MALNFAEKVPFNIISNVIKVVIISLIGIWVVPYYINSLGISAYGIIPLATTLTSYMLIVIDAICGACTRYSIVSIRQNDNPSKHISTCFFGVLKLCLFALPIIIIISVCSPIIFNTGEIPNIDVQIMFLLVLSASLISSLASVFRCVFESFNSVYYCNIIDCVYSIAQVVFVIILFVSDKPSLIMIGISFFCSAILVFILTYVFAHKVYSNYLLKLKLFDEELYLKIRVLAKWNIISAIGSVLFIQASIIIVNIFLGSNYSGQFGLVASFISMITTACAIITHSFGPFVFRYYAENDLDTMNKVLTSGLKFVSLIVAMPLAYVMVFSPQIITAWVGSEYSSLGDYIFVVCLVYVIYCSFFTLTSIPNTFLAVHESSRLAILFGAFNVILAIILCVFTELKIWGVIISYSLSILLYSLSYTLLCERLIKVKKLHLVKLMLRGVLSLMVCFVVMKVIAAINIIEGTWISVIVSFVLLFIIYVTVITFIGLNKNDKDMVEEILVGKFRSVFHHIFNRS